MHEQYVYPLYIISLSSKCTFVCGRWFQWLNQYNVQCIHLIHPETDWTIPIVTMIDLNINLPKSVFISQWLHHLSWAIDNNSFVYHHCRAPFVAFENSNNNNNNNNSAFELIHLLKTFWVFRLWIYGQGFNIPFNLS